MKNVKKAPQEKETEELWELSGAKIKKSKKKAPQEKKIEELWELSGAKKKKSKKKAPWDSWNGKERWSERRVAII